MATGTQVAPDMLQPDFFPDWGGHVKTIADNLDLWRRGTDAGQSFCRGKFY